MNANEVIASLASRALMPVISRNLLDSIGLLACASRLLADRCVSGITTDGRTGSAAP